MIDNKLVPKKIVEELDKYIVSQDEAKKMWRFLLETDTEEKK